MILKVKDIGISVIGLIIIGVYTIIWFHLANKKSKKFDEEITNAENPQENHKEYNQDLVCNIENLAFSYFMFSIILFIVCIYIKYQGKIDKYNLEMLTSFSTMYGVFMGVAIIVHYCEKKTFLEKVNKLELIITGLSTFATFFSYLISRVAISYCISGIVMFYLTEQLFIRILRFYKR